MKSRYVAFTQQPYCCVPASLQMVMHRRNIPLVEQEGIGYALGLTVPEEESHLFNKVHTGKKPLAGWGTQVYKPEFDINKALKKLGIPFQVRIHTIDYLESAEKLKKLLSDCQKADGDALLCFENSVLWKRDHKNGHVVVFDRIEGEDVWVVDPSRSLPKHHRISVNRLYQAMLEHGSKKSAGAWEIF